MRLLLDTHVVLWALLSPERLSGAAAAAIVDPANDVLVSAVTSWEIAIKQGLGKLQLPGPAESWLIPACDAAGFRWMDISPLDAVRVRGLPLHHHDPFDRLLVSVAMNGLTIVTADENIPRYGVPVLRASR